MKVREINFITISSEKFFPYVNFTAKKLMKLYPSCKLFIYDWGLTSSHKKKLRSYPISILVDWKFNIDWMSGYKTIEISNDLSPSIRKKKEGAYLANQKPLCILDCAKRVKENLIYFDADAILINPIDEIFEDNFDVGITILNDELFEEIEFLKFYMGADLNAGVIFFRLSSKNMQLFIQEWLNEIERSKKPEQISLFSLIKDRNKEIFKKSYNVGTITLSNTEFKIKAFPATIYNLFRIHRGYDDKKVKFLHFLRAPHMKEKSLTSFLRDIIIEIKFRHVYFNFLKLFPLMIKNSIKRIFRVDLLVKLIIYPLDFFWIRFNFFKIIENLKKEFLNKEFLKKQPPKFAYF
ncbi:MAG: hypothetical protein ACFFAH_14740 [Promethearchaeota archaeon]